MAARSRGRDQRIPRWFKVGWTAWCGYWLLGWLTVGWSVFPWNLPMALFSIAMVAIAYTDGRARRRA